MKNTIEGINQGFLGFAMMLPLDIFGVFFLRFAIPVTAGREVWDFAFRNWERLGFERLYGITLNLCNTKLNFSAFGIMYCLILTSVTLYSST